MSDSVLPSVVAKFKRELIKKLGVGSENISELFFGEIKPDVKFTLIKKVSESVVASNFHTISALDESHFFQSRHLISTDNVSVDTKTGVVFDGNSRILAESTSWPKESVILNVLPKPPHKLKTLEIDVQNQVLVMPSNGFYHWLIEDLPLFLKTLNSLSNPKVLVFEDAYKYVYEFLDGMNIPYVKVPRFIKLSNFYFITHGNDTGWPHPEDLSELNRISLPISINDNSAEKIYISRRGSTRSPSFEEKLENDLKNKNWRIVKLEDLSFWDQVNLASQAKTICGVHGAGLSAATWMSAGTKIIEIGSNRHVPCFSRLASSKNISYELIRFEEVSYPDLLNGIVDYSNK